MTNRTAQEWFNSYENYITQSLLKLIIFWFWEHHEYKLRIMCKLLHYKVEKNMKQIISISNKYEKWKARDLSNKKLQKK